MTLLRPIQTSFNAGEVSPRMSGRVDTSVYQAALETCENFVPTVEGPVVKFPGFEIIEPAAATARWLTTFRFNNTQQYVIEWSEGKLRFFTNGARIETSPGVPYEVTVPYAAAEAALVSQQQSYDRLYMDHGSHPPARLTRTGASTFVYDVPELTNGPFADTNGDDTIGIGIAATTGTHIGVQSTSPLFVAGHAGSLLRLEATDFATIEAWQVGIDGINPGTIRRNEGKVYTAVDGAGAAPWRTGTIAPTHSEGSAWDGSTGTDINVKGPYGVQWEYRHDRFGIVRITSIVNDSNAYVDVLRRVPDSVTLAGGTPRWAFGLFSEAAGWPSIVVKSFGRLCHFKLFDLCASVAGDFWNHATFTSTGTIAADLAFRRTLDADNPPLWAIGDRKLLAGTVDAELAIGALNTQAAVAGDNITSEKQSFYGSAPVWPLQAGISTFFVQIAGRKLRDAAYAFGPDRYVAANATVYARHITKSGIVQLAFQKDPEELLIGVRGDGQLFVHPHQPEQEIKGFARRVHSDGACRILSAVTIRSEDGLRDELWALVERVDDGFKSIERMADWRDDDDDLESAFYVDSGVRATAAAGQTHFSLGLDHLAGRAVWVLAAGGVIKGLTVSAGGTLDLPVLSVPADRAYQIAVGLPYTATCVTMRPELKLNGETSQGKRQKLQRLVLRLLGTVGIRVGQKGGILDNLIDRPASANMDAPIPPFTGDSSKGVSGTYDRGGQAMWVSDTPLPATVAAAMPTIGMEPPAT